MPVIATFFGIVIRMYFADHAPPHFHAEYQGQRRHLTFAENFSRATFHLKPRAG
jgi:hypothetical protein